MKLKYETPIFYEIMRPTSSEKQTVLTRHKKAQNASALSRSARRLLSLQLRAIRLLTAAACGEAAEHENENED